MIFRKRFVIYFFIFIVSLLTTPSCKTKKAPLKLSVKLPPARTVVVQVCDKFQMSYDGLSCTVYFTNGSSSPYRTAIDGKITINLPFPQTNIEKIVYDFTGYAQKAGTLLAKEDYKMAKKITSNKLNKTVVIQDTFSSKNKNLFVLIRI